MTDPRLVDRDDRSSRLLRAMRDDAPPAGSEARMLAALGLATTATTAAGTAAAATKSALIPAKWLVLCVGAVALGTIAVLARPRPQPLTASPPATSFPPTTPSVVTAPAPPIASVPEPVAAPPVSAAPRPPKKPQAAVGLGPAIALIDAARTALAAHDPNVAIRALDRHDQEFPASPLRPEADVLRAEALAMRGDRTAAVALANAIVQRMPGTANARRAQAILDANIE